MNCVRLSDAQLLRLIREGGETCLPALHELEQRHFHAVWTFAAASAVRSPAADELAYQSWQEALQQQADGSVSGAVRPCALASVLRTASGWARGSRRIALNPHLADWIRTNGPVLLGPPAAAGFSPPSLVARAFAGLPHRSQTILWHQTVERDGSALTGRLSGAGSGEVSVLTGRARRELYDSYVQVLRDGMQDECRYYHRLVLAYADVRSSNIAAEVAPHLERCARCVRTVADLGHLRHDCGALLARALLPWGGLEYAARGTNEGATREVFMTGAGMAGTAAARGLPVGERTREGVVPDSLATGRQEIGGRATGRGRHAAFAAAGTAGAGTKGRRRADLVVRCTAVAGVCAVGAAFAFGFVGDFTTGKPQSREPAPPIKALPSPSETSGPSRATATAKSTAKSTSNPTSKPTETKPAPPEPSTTRPSPPDVDNAALEWLFDKVDGDGVTPDSSANNKDGTLFGASRPRPVSGGALAFDGRQFVASDGPLLDTSSSFSVSARVRLNRTDVSQTVVSQDASESSAFLLQYDADESQWEMRIPEEDTDDVEADADEAVSESEPKEGEWTHLTGVYDDADDQVRLYVDGRLGETVEREGDFGSEGNFAVGRGLSGNEFFQGLEGAADDVQAFGRAVSSAEARALARKR